MNTRKLLVVSAAALEPDVVSTLRLDGWDLHLTRDAQAASAALAREGFAVGLAVLRPEADSAEATGLARLVQGSPGVHWVLAADPRRIHQPDCCLAVAAESLFTYISLPLDAEQLGVILDHACGMAQVHHLFLASQEIASPGEFGMVGGSPPMRELYQQMERAATCDAPVVLTGESGTGKEVAARGIHEHSAHGNGPFVVVNCAAIPDSLIQAELFGYEKGAFTGAVSPRPGYVETADSGTLFLDEVAELSPEAQSSLLRTLENGQVTRLGSLTHRTVRLRTIATSQQELSSLVQAGKFRLDLYYRLQVLELRVPSLRERGTDITALAQHFLEASRRRGPIRAQGFTRAALVRMQQYDWPGNLRELRNRIHQAALECTGRWITPALLRLERRSGRRDAATLRDARDRAEIQAIRSALGRNGQSTLRAAEELQVSRMTLYRLMQKHGIESSP